MIACRGRLRSVRIFYREKVTLNEISTINVTRESVVSKKILKHLLSKYYLKRITFKEVDITLLNIDDMLKDRPTLLIGDLALIASTKYETVLDICELWNRIYNSPLVFAILLIRKNLESEYSDLLPFLRSNLRSKIVKEFAVKFSSHWIKQYVSHDVLREYILDEIMYEIDSYELTQALCLIKQALSQAHSQH